MNMLVLRLTAPEQHDVQYAVFGRDNLQAAWQQTTWAFLPPLLKRARHIIILIPSREILLTTLTLNASNQRQLMQALPYALEEQLMTDPETQHYVWHSLDKTQGLGQVAVIEHARLQTWLDFLHHNGIVPYAILPDLVALPFSAGTTTAWLQPEGLWLRQGEFSGYYSSANSWSLHLKQWQTNGSTETPTRIRILANAPQPTASPALEIILDDETQTQTLVREDWQIALPLNLAKGFRTQAYSQLSDIWQQWRGVLAVGLVTALIASVIQVVEIRQLHDQNEALTQDNIQRFKALFPQAGTIDPALSLRSIMTSELKKQQSKTPVHSKPSSALPLLKALAQVLPQQPIVLQGLDWRQNKLTVRFSTDSTEAVSALEKALTTTLQRDITINYQREANKVVGEFTLASEQAK